MKKKSQGFSVIEAVLIFAIISLIGLIGWRVWQSGMGSDSTQNSTASENNAQQQPKTEQMPKGYKKYESTAGFSFLYKEGWRIETSEEKQDSSASRTVLLSLFPGEQTDPSISFLKVKGGASNCEQTTSEIKKLTVDGKKAKQFTGGLQLASTTTCVPLSGDTTLEITNYYSNSSNKTPGYDELVESITFVD